MKLARLITATILSSVVIGYSWQLPGTEGSDYRKGENVEIHADEAASEEVAGFKFDIEFAWCRPSEVDDRKKLKILNPRTEESIKMIDTSFYYQVGVN